jgi:glycerol-3-phosphate acyltransferase PlsY
VNGPFPWLLAAAYLLGAIPCGLLVGLARGVDPRRAGSGNIGATNVGRLLGGRYFALVFILDMLKALLPTLVAGYFARRLAADGRETTACLLWMAVGLAAVVGHIFPVYLGFRGGKGVAAAAGAMLGLFPYVTLPALAAIVVFVIVFFVWRYISLASMAAAVAFPILYAIFSIAVFGLPVLGARWPLPAGAVLVAVLIIWRHRTNIHRLLAGTEPPFRASR